MAQLYILCTSHGPGILVWPLPPCEGAWHYIPTQNKASIPACYPNSRCHFVSPSSTLLSSYQEQVLACVALPPNVKRHKGQAASVCGLSPQPILCCHFLDTGFPFENGFQSRPCCRAYHTQCISVGTPSFELPQVWSWALFP